jgi:hypothetical protein
MRSILAVILTIDVLFGCASNSSLPASCPNYSEPLRGTVVLFDERGGSHVPMDGTMQVYLSPWDGDDAFEEVRIHGGNWTCSRPCARHGYAIGRMLLDGDEAYSQESVFEYQGEKFIALEAEPMEPAFVHVVDQLTGADISSVSLREVVTYGGGREGAGALVFAGDGRFALDQWRAWPFPGAYKEGRGFWIEAPGYEPRIQFINPWKGGDWTVELAADP